MLSDENSHPACWICGTIATSAEHRFKKTDLANAIGYPSQEKPFYIHTFGQGGRRNVPFYSLDAKRLKHEKSLCIHCNTTRTQQHDRAWEATSNFLTGLVKNNSQIRIVRLNRLFRYNTKFSMINLHLFFVKLFGCRCVENKVPIPLGELATSIMKQKICHNIYLKFIVNSSKYIGGSHVNLWNQIPHGPLLYANYFYSIGQVGVDVIFSNKNINTILNSKLWNPTIGTAKLTLAKYIDWFDNPYQAEN